MEKEGTGDWEKRGQAEGDKWSRSLFQISGADAEAFTKSTVKNRVITKSAHGSGLPGRKAFPDQTGGIEQALLADVGMHRTAGLLFEKTHEIIPAQVDSCGEKIDGEFGRQIFIDE